jgi:hemerythrin
VALLNWENKYSVGVAEIDAQHQKWFGILNRLHEAMLAGNAQDLQRSILTEMVAYTRTHFLQEELMLKTRGYPMLAAHSVLHVDFAKKVQDIETKLQAGGSVLTIDIMEFLKQWLAKHILTQDTQYGGWLKQH